MGSLFSIYAQVMKRINPKAFFTDTVIDDHNYDVYFRGSYKAKTMRFNRETTVWLCNNITNQTMEDMRMDAGLSQQVYYKIPF